MTGPGPLATVATVRAVCPHHPGDGALVEFVRLANGLEMVQNVRGWAEEYVSTDPVDPDANVRDFPDGHPFAGVRVKVGVLPVASAVESARPGDVEHGREVFTCPRPSCGYGDHWRQDGERGRFRVVGALLDQLAGTGSEVLTVAVVGGRPRPA